MLRFEILVAVNINMQVLRFSWWLLLCGL